MLPTFQVFGITIAPYGIMIGIGLVIGVLLMSIRGKKYHIKTEDALFASYFGGIGLFLGAKILYFLINSPNFLRRSSAFLSHPSLMLNTLIGGYVFYGGLLGAGLGIWLYTRIYHLDFIQILDLAAPSIPIIHGFGRIGCFFAGCRYGIPYTGFGHVIFHYSMAAPNQIPLLPIQLIEGGFNFITGILLLIFANPSRRPGRMIGIYITYYAVLRFIMEFFRGDLVRGFLLGLSTSQWISLLLFPIGVYCIVGYPNKKMLK